MDEDPMFLTCSKDGRLEVVVWEVAVGWWPMCGAKLATNWFTCGSKAKRAWAAASCWLSRAVVGAADDGAGGGSRMAGCWGRVPQLPCCKLVW